MGLSRIKTESRKYGRDTPSPASRPISVFFRKYENRRDKYRNTGGAGRDFFLSVFILILILDQAVVLPSCSCIGLFGRAARASTGGPPAASCS